MAFFLAMATVLVRAAAAAPTPGAPIRYGGKNPGPPPGAAEGTDPEATVAGADAPGDGAGGAEGVVAAGEVLGAADVAPAAGQDPGSAPAGTSARTGAGGWIAARPAIAQPRLAVTTLKAG